MIKELMFKEKAVNIYLSKNGYYLVVFYSLKIDFYNYHTNELIFSLKLKYANIINFSPNYGYCTITYEKGKICLIDMISCEIVYKTNSYDAESCTAFIDNNNFIYYKYKLDSNECEGINSSIIIVNIIDKTQKNLFVLNDILIYKVQFNNPIVTFLGCRLKDEEKYPNDLILCHYNVFLQDKYKIYMINDIVEAERNSAFNYETNQCAVEVFYFGEDEKSLINIYNQDSTLKKRIEIDSYVKDFSWINNGEYFLVNKINGVEIFDSNTFESIENLLGLSLCCNYEYDSKYFACLFVDGCILYTIE